MNRQKTLKVLLLIGALILSVFLILEYNALVVLLRSFWKWSLNFIHVVGSFLKGIMTQFLRSFITRRVLRPIWIALGLAWLGGYVGKWFKLTLGLRVSTGLERLRNAWQSLPWYLKAASILGLLAAVFFLGWGLWILPFGVPFLGRVVTRVKAFWADSWLKRRTQSIRFRLRAFVRRNRGNPIVISFRWSRYRLIRRDRAWSAKADKAVETIIEKRFGNEEEAQVN